MNERLVVGVILVSTYFSTSNLSFSHSWCTGLEIILIVANITVHKVSKAVTCRLAGEPNKLYGSWYRSEHLTLSDYCCRSQNVFGLCVVLILTIEWRCDISV